MRRGLSIGGKADPWFVVSSAPCHESERSNGLGRSNQRGPQGAQWPGKPVIKGTRIAVEFLMELMANGWTHEQILANYPHLTEDDIQAALHYATETVKQEHVYPLPV